jgi:hypothetical protein
MSKHSSDSDEKSAAKNRCASTDAEIRQKIKSSTETTSSESERAATTTSRGEEEDPTKVRVSVKSNSTSSTSTEEEVNNRRDYVKPIFSLSNPERVKVGDKHRDTRLHTGQKKPQFKHSVPLINELQGSTLPKTGSPRTSMVKDMHGAFGTGHDNSRLFISPRVMGGKGISTDPTQPGVTIQSPRKVLNLKNHIVEIPMKQPLKLMEQDAVTQFLSPRMENSPRVFEARMIDLQQQYERQNAHLTKTNQKKSEEINNQALKINELSIENEALKAQLQEVQKEIEQTKQVTSTNDKEDIESLTENLTNLALENMELRTRMGKIQGGSVVCENSLQLLHKLHKDENMAVLKNSVFEFNQKQLSYDRSVELYEQEIRKVIHSARHSIVKEKEKRKQMEQEILALHGKIRELEFFIIEELADLANFSEGDQGDSVGSLSDPYNYEDGEEYDDDPENDDEEDVEERNQKSIKKLKDNNTDTHNFSDLSSS